MKTKMNIAVIYKSKYGFTKTYAEWLANDLAADLLPADNVKPTDLQKYDTIIYGGGLYVGAVSGIELITKNFESIKDKSLYLFTVGMADVDDMAYIESIRKSLSGVLSPEMLEKIKLYHLRGGVSYSTMGFIHRIMMSMVSKMLRKKSKSEPELAENIILETYGKDIDFRSREAIAPIVSDVLSKIN